MDEKKIKISDFNELIEKLKFFKDEMIKYDYIHDKSSFFKIMREFRKYISGIRNEELCQKFYHSKYRKRFKSFFREKNNYYMRALESVEALSIMTKGIHGKTTFIDLLDAEHIKDNYFTKGEDIKYLDFENSKNMVMVGCGPLPETIMYFFENTNLDKIIGLDNNYEAIYIAGEMINSLGFKNIELKYMAGEDYDYKDADIVYIPGFVENKNEILDRIAETSKDKVQIIVWSSNYLSKLLYESIPSELHPRLKKSEIKESIGPYTNRNMIKLEKYNF